MHRAAHAVTARHPDRTTPVVALCEHGLRAVQSVIGVIGAARLLVPLDVRDPHERLSSIVTTSGATLVVTTRDHADDALAIAPACAVLFLDEIDAFPDGPFRVEIDEHTPGIVIFTSGSTGAPKGVVLSHAAIVGKAIGQLHTGSVMTGERSVLNASFAYTTAYSRLFGSLCNGATVYTYDPRSRGQRAYPEWINTNGIDSVGFMTPLLRSLTDAPETAKMPAVRNVSVGGDTVYGRDIVRARPLFGPDTAFQTGFASTECGAIASYHLPPGIDPDPGVVPFGLAHPWVEITITDPETGVPVPDGEPGRLVVVSPFVALRYFAEPELTAATFFTTPDGRRGYRSSDLVRRRPDGLLEHLGRIDARVKIRGALVALSEVERVLVSLAGVGAAAVVGAPLPDGGHRLIAYVVPAPGPSPSAWQLRRDVGARLPTTMVPSAVVFVDELPLNPSGKLIRSALPPAPEPARVAYVAPVGSEGHLSEVFAEVLGVDRVGRDDDFFDLGGDSLGVVELLAAIQEHFGVEVVASTILEAPTVRELAPRLTHRRGSGSSVVVPLRTTGKGIPFFCVTGGGAPALSLRALAEAMAAGGGEERPFYAVQPRGLEERAFPDRTIEAAARRVMREIRAAWPSGPFILGGYSFGGTVAFETACRMEAEGLRLLLLVVLDALAPGVRVRPTRAQRVERRGQELRANAPSRTVEQAATMAARAARLGWRSALAHADRRVALTSAGLFPRQGLDQYELFLRLNGNMARVYRPQATFSGPAVVVRSEVPPGRARTLDDLGWSTAVRGPISIVDVPGDHLSMVRHPNVATLGSRLAGALEEVT
jgi:acyl-coenzyme A synthetase/AMP-(fatty) acid ligase/thioesterase domain-containing protein/acyl carrier protein